MSIAAIYFLVAGKAGLIISRRAYSRTGKTWNASFSYLPVFNKSSHSCRFSLPDSIYFFLTLLHRHVQSTRLKLVNVEIYMTEQLLAVSVSFAAFQSSCPVGFTTCHEHKLPRGRSLSSN